MDQEVTHIRSMDVSRYRHDFGDFCEKLTYLLSINMEIITTNQGIYASFVATLSFLFFLSW